MMTLLFYLYVFLIPLEIYTEKIPKGLTGLNYANVMMTVLVLWWMVGRPLRGRGIVMPSPLNPLICLLLLWTYFGIVLTGLTLPGTASPFDPLGEPFKRFLQFYNGFLLFFVAANMIDTRRKIFAMLIVLSLVSIPVVRAFRSDLVGVLSWHFSNAMRVRGPFVWIGSNELGAFFVFSALFLGMFAFGPWPLIVRGILAGACTLYSYGILYSYSRATQLAFLAAVALASFIRYRITLVLVVLLALSSPVWLPYSVKERWQKTTDESGQLESSAQSRKDFAHLAWGLFLRSPLTGHGVGSYSLLNPAQMDTHNHYLRTLAESGLIGFGLLLALWGTVLAMAWRLWRRASHRFDVQYGFSLLIATVGLMITNFFGDRFTHLPMIGQYWVLVGMGARLYAGLTGAEALAEAGEPPAPVAEPAVAAGGAGERKTPVTPGVRAVLSGGGQVRILNPAASLNVRVPRPGPLTPGFRPRSLNVISPRAPRRPN